MYIFRGPATCAKLKSNISNATLDLGFYCLTVWHNFTSACFFSQKSLHPTAVGTHHVIQILLKDDMSEAKRARMGVASPLMWDQYVEENKEDDFFFTGRQECCVGVAGAYAALYGAKPGAKLLLGPIRLRLRL